MSPLTAVARRSDVTTASAIVVSPFIRMPCICSVRTRYASNLAARIAMSRLWLIDLDGCTEIAENPDAFMEWEVSLSAINFRLTDRAAFSDASAALNVGTVGKLELTVSQPTKANTADPTA